MTAANSCIVLSEALAPAPMAAELIKHLPTYAPNLVRYLDQCQSKIVRPALDQTRCTALETWQVEQAGFPAATAKHNAALALLLASKAEKTATIAPDKPFWLAELVHLAPSRDGAALIPATDLQITPEQSQELLNAAQLLCEGTDFRLEPWSAHHWQLHSAIELPAVFASPALVSRSAVNDWWDQNPATREWRRFVNELQMLYFNHPVNQARLHHGLPPINSLWPVGGLAGNAWQPQPRPYQLFDTLTEPYLRQDWGLWLQSLQQLDLELKTELSHQPDLVLTNTEQLLIASPRPTRFWHRFMQPTSTWRSHWLVQS